MSDQNDPKADTDGIKIIRDINVIKIGIEETRMKILALLRLNNLTVSQIADTLGKDQSTIYRHIEKLEKNGYVYPSGERKTHHIPEKVYSRTAKVFLLVPEGGELSDRKKMMKDQSIEKKLCLLNMLKKMGLVKKVSKEGAEKLSEIFAELEKDNAEHMELIKDEKEIGLHTVWTIESINLLLKYRRDEDFRKKMEEALTMLEAE